MDMPYNDNTFDVVISIFVTCNLSNEVLTKHVVKLSCVLLLAHYYSYSLNYAGMTLASPLHTLNHYMIYCNVIA